MLEAYIIQKLKEDRESRYKPQPLYIPAPARPPRGLRDEKHQPPRGVVIIQL